MHMGRVRNWELHPERRARSQESPLLLVFLLLLRLVLIGFTVDTGSRRLRKYTGTCVVVC